MVEIFLDNTPLVHSMDVHVAKLKDAAQYFDQFYGKEVKFSFTAETTYDTLCTLRGLVELITMCTAKRVSVVPGLLNSDVIENHFSMV
jgi:hypothetical protein